MRDGLGFFAERPGFQLPGEAGIRVIARVW
jgi:hypothetical protein